MDDFWWAVQECYKRNGPPPKIGTFEPQIGDLAEDADGHLKTWDGKQWR